MKGAEGETGETRTLVRGPIRAVRSARSAVPIMYQETQCIVSLHRRPRSLVNTSALDTLSGAAEPLRL